MPQILKKFWCPHCTSILTSYNCRVLYHYMENNKWIKICHPKSNIMIIQVAPWSHFLLASRSQISKVRQFEGLFTIYDLIGVISVFILLQPFKVLSRIWNSFSVNSEFRYEADWISILPSCHFCTNHFLLLFNRLLYK